MSYNIRKEAALRYAGLGWPVVPMENSYPRDVLSPSCDPATICRWWRTWPSASVGVATGACSGIFVLEVVTKTDGFASLAALEKKFGPLPMTATALRGTGAPQFYFRHPGETVPNGVTPAAGLVVRGDGGYVIAPPSRYKRWPPNSWAIARSPEECPPAEPPTWLLELIQFPFRWNGVPSHPQGDSPDEAGEVQQ